MEVVVDSIAASPTGLHLGVVIRYGKDGPVRFSRGFVPWDLMTPEIRAMMLEQFNRMMDREPSDVDVPLF